MYNKQAAMLPVIKKYEILVKQFVLDERGHVLVYTTDAIVAKILRGTFATHLQLKGNYLRFSSIEEELLKDARRISTYKAKLFFFIERIVSNHTNNQLIKFLKLTYPECKIILMTTEAERNLLVYLHEIGADNFIVKPVSVDTLIEKIALTISPQGQLGKLVESGKEMIEQGAYDKALEIAGDILALKPNSSAALMIQGDAWLRLGRDEESLQAYMQASENAQMYLEPLKKIVAYYKEKNNAKGQLQYLNKLERLSPMNMDRKIEIGQLHLEQGDKERADHFFQEALKVSAKQAREMMDNIKLCVAEACLQVDPTMAERYFREIVEGKSVLAASDAHIYNRLGIALRKQGKWEEAIKEFTAVLKVALEKETILYNIGMAYMEGGRFGEADTAFEKALRINKNGLLSSEITTYNIGVCMQHNGKISQAREMYLRVKELNPDFPGIDKRLAGVN